MPYMPKPMVNYHEAKPDAERKCGNCIMFRSPDHCTLVIGEIQAKDVCNEWEPKKLCGKASRQQ